ncbi:hypothetical protein [uncultured Sunxiuqinia sp.]|uniref:hypothetical protein n=1 Tax=uncultured Sunxiuqinia sp. TaxID=1573825 RepID=UPI002AA931F2|nr:hypothetical protein [uncultured Sunxiuqinia sp.]
MFSWFPNAGFIVQIAKWLRMENAVVARLTKKQVGVKFEPVASKMATALVPIAPQPIHTNARSLAILSPHFSSFSSDPTARPPSISSGKMAVNRSSI